MLLKFVNSNKAGLQIFILAIVLLLWLHTLIEPFVPASFNTALAGPLGRLLVNPLSERPVLSALIAMLVVLLCGFLLNQLNSRYALLKTKSQLPQLFFILVAGSLPSLRFLTPALISAFFVILMVYRLFKSYKKDRLVFNFLDAGILLAVAVMIYLPAVFLLPLLLITLLLFGNMVWQEWTYPWIGFCLPFLFWGSYLFMADRPLSLMTDEFNGLFSAPGIVHDYSLIQWVFYAYLALLVLIGSYFMIRTIGMRKIQSRIFFIFFLWMFLFSIPAGLLIPSAEPMITITGGIAVAFLVSNYFAQCSNNRFNNLLLLLLFAGIMLVIADDWFGFLPGIRP